MLIYRALTDTHISHDEFALVNNVLREYNDMKEEMKNLKTLTFRQKFWFIYKTLLSYLFEV